MTEARVQLFIRKIGSINKQFSTTLVVTLFHLHNFDGGVVDSVDEVV